jgi:predicted transcriptional regulator
MKSNADKLKEEKGSSKDQEVVENQENKEVESTKEENKDKNKKENKEKNKLNNTIDNKVYNKDENTTKKNASKVTNNIDSGDNNEEIRRTYYLRKSIVNEIDSFARKTGNNKSYLVELALTYFLNQPDIGAKLVKKEDSPIDLDPTKLIIPNQKDKKKVRRTYYLKEKMIEKLDSIADRTEQDKSFIVEEALTFLFENAEIQ